MKNELLQMKIGYTKVINGVAVTRWAEDKWEAGTWGKETTGIEETIKRVLQ